MWGSTTVEILISKPRTQLDTSATCSNSAIDGGLSAGNNGIGGYLGARAKHFLALIQFFVPPQEREPPLEEAIRRTCITSLPFFYSTPSWSDQPENWQYWAKTVGWFVAVVSYATFLCQTLHNTIMTTFWNYVNVSVNGLAENTVLSKASAGVWSSGSTGYACSFDSLKINAGKWTQRQISSLSLYHESYAFDNGSTQCSCSRLLFWSDLSPDIIRTYMRRRCFLGLDCFAF